MTNYAAEANKAVKKFDSTEEIKKGAASIADTAQSYIKNASKNVGDMASEGKKFLKNEGKKDLRRAESFIKENPLKGAAYAAGIGALLTYFFMPRK
jgi:ElaB/YqjD/DUF883 family membrane-anchored ribosome-binding protein